MNKIYNIREYGAAGDGITYDTAAIQRAVDTCFDNGGGAVIVPAGAYLTGDITLRSYVTLHLLSGAKLVGSRNTADYFNYRNDKYAPVDPGDISDEAWYREDYRQDTSKSNPFFRARLQVLGSRWNNAIIRAWDSENFAIIGDEGSFIDGMDCYDEIGEEGYRGPHGMSFHRCRNITLKGYTIRKAGNWAHNTVFCENIHMEDVTVLAGHDGIHLSGCCNIVIKNCNFYTGDDSIAGFANLNVTVSGCEINSACSAFRFGGTNMLVTNCHIFAPARYGFRYVLTPEEKASSAPSPTSGIRNNMLSAFTYYSDYSLPIKHQPGNIVMENCRIEGADRFLHFNFSGNERWQVNRPLADITFKNIKAEGISMPITAYGAKDVPFKLTVANTEIGIREGAEITALVHACNCDAVELTDVKLEGFKGDCLVRAWSDVPVKVEVVGADCPAIKRAETEFTAKPI